MTHAYPHCAEVLYQLFSGLDMTKTNTDEFNEEWENFKKSGDSVAMITWFAKRFNLWSSPKYLERVKNHQARQLLRDVSIRIPKKIMSPDRKVDWTTAVWWIHDEINSNLPFTQDVLSLMEESLSSKRRKMDATLNVKQESKDLCLLLTRLRASQDAD